MTLLPQYRPVIFEDADPSNSNILRDYAEFWKIPWQGKAKQDDQHTIFRTDDSVAPARNVTVIVSPRGREVAERIARDHGLTIDWKEARITLPVAPDATVRLKAVTHQFSGPNLESVLRSGDISILSHIRGTGIYLLAVDLVGEYARRVYGGFVDKPSRRFWLATKLPFSYQSIPRFIR